MSWSCQKDMLSDEQISENLLGSGGIGGIEGSIDPKLLIGEWEPVRFAFTADGKEIKNRENISITDDWGRPYYLEINDFPYEYKERMMFRFPLPVDLSDLFGYWYYLNLHLFYSISDNLISYRPEINGYFLASWVGADYNKEELNIIGALQNVHSFVIRNNELIIYFKGDENKNLLILKKTHKDVIADNLSKKGSVDPTLLLGEWDCVKFACTDDGNKIEDIAGVQKGHIRINEAGLWICHTSMCFVGLTTNGKWFRKDFSTRFIHTPQEEADIIIALLSMYSYVIKDDELIIYFILNGSDSNLLILKRHFPSHEMISDNLSKIGNTEPELLVGEWDCVKFASTVVGNIISDVSDISTTGKVIIPDLSNLFLTIKLYDGFLLDGIPFDCLIKGNMIKLSNASDFFYKSYWEKKKPDSPDLPYRGQIFNLLSSLMHYENDDAAVAFALANAYSFVINDDEFIIYFIGTDDKNIIILKRR